MSNPFGLGPSNSGFTVSPPFNPTPGAPARLPPVELTLNRVLGSNENLRTPLGFCLGPNDTVAVADTDNHRVVVFKAETGHVENIFGEYGADEGHLVQPRKITMIPQAILTPNDEPLFVVCDRGLDRSRLQLFQPNGTFVRAIRIPSVDIVSGLTGTQDRKIVLVDSIRAEVYVFNEYGDRLFYFNCTDRVREPGDIAVHNKHYYLCDFQGHCICVFSPNGDLVKKIGSQYAGSLINYPNGIEVSDSGEILVADSHGNQFHVNIFHPESGRLMGTFRLSGFKLSGCVGLKVCSTGHILSLSKNNKRVLVIDPIHITD